MAFYVYNHAEVEYKTNQYWNKNYERSIIWNDPDLAIEWPIEFLMENEIILSDSDKKGITINKAEAEGDIFMKVLITGSEGQLGKELTRTKPNNVRLFALNKSEFNLSSASECKTVINQIKP